MQSKTVPRKPKSLEAVVDRISNVSTLPQVALAVMQIAGDVNTGAADLKKVVEEDPALTVRIIRSANAAAHGLRNRITNIQRAISYLGFGRIRNIVVTTSVSAVFKSDQTIKMYRRPMLWRHLVATAIAARLIATRCGLANFEDAYLAGLLHDIGIVLEDQYVHPNFRYLIESLTEERTLTAGEYDVLGFDHTVLGEEVAKMWKFPPAIRAAIRFHHDSQNSADEHAMIVCCVEAANILCSLKGITSVGLKLVTTSVHAFKRLGLEKSDITDLAIDIDKALSESEDILGAGAG